jgi:hypothetical protein
MASKTYAECVAELPIRDNPLEFTRTEHSVKFKFVTFDGYLKPAIFTNLGELARLTEMSNNLVQVTHEIREIRYQRHKFTLQK